LVDIQQRRNQLEASHAKALAEARGEVVKQLKALLANPSGKLDATQTQTLAETLNAIESNSPSMLWK